MAIQPKTLSPILPIRSVPEVSKIQQINPIQAIQPVYGYKSISAKKQTYNRNKQQIKTFLSNYNDPTELNSYIDALTNREAVAKKFGDTWAGISTTAGTASLIADIASIVLTVTGWIVSALVPDAGTIGVGAQAAGTAIKAGTAVSKGAKAVSVINKTVKGLKNASKLLAIPAIPAALDVTVEKGIKPILAGKPDEAGLNMLMNLGETMDRYANPVKGLILEGPEGFVKGTGLSKEGRVNYDYDTGFFLTDMLLEIVTDPINVLQVAGKIGQKTAVKATIKTTTQTLTDNIDNVIRTGAVKGFKSITEEGSQRIFKTVNKATASVSAEWAEASAEGFMKQAKELAIKIKGKPFILLSKTEQEEVIKIAKDRFLKDGRDKIQKALVRALHKEFPEATTEEIEILLKKSGKNFAKNSALQSAREIIDNIEFDTLSSQTIKGTAALLHATDASDAWMVKNAMLTSGYGLGVELIKDGFIAKKVWASNIALRSLKDAKAFNPVSGLDIKKYVDAKKLWKASYNYVYEITGEKSVRDMAAFQEFVNQQFNRDKQFITLVMQNSTDAIKRSGQLEGQFNTLYQCTFKDYVGFIKGINDAENGAFNEYVKYLEHTLEVLGDHAARQGAGETIKTAQSLFNIKDMAPDNIVLKLQDAIKNTDSPIELVEKLYTIKMNDAYVNSILINDPRISEVLMEINSSEKVGALLNKISGDLNALAPEVATQIPVAVRTIKEAGASFANIKELYTEIAGTNFAKVKGITDNDFRKYIIDQIFGLKTKSVIELLAEFDSITMPSLKNGLEVLLYDKGFKFADYPALEDQIAGIYKRFLEAQQSAGLKEVNATIVQDFTKSIDDLIQYTPNYADELQELAIANIQIKTTLDFIRNKNFTLLESVFTTKETIFNVLNQRQLTDAGLALKTVSIKQNLDLFDLPKEWSGNLIKSADRLGASLNHLMESLAQYSVVFDETVSVSLNNAYTAFRKQFIDNLAYSEFEKYPAFQYLRKATDPIEQFAQLVEFNKLAKTIEDSKIFKNILSENLDTTTYLNVMNPSKLLVTDFAWNPMAQSAWVAKTQFNEDMVNAINLYRNFDLSVQKGVADFRELQNTLSTHKLDRVKALQNERYIRTLSRYTDSFNELKTYYDSLFDKDLAKLQLENVREVLINFPELSAKYSRLVDALEKFWNGELELRQDPKEYVKAGVLPDGTKAVDEVTPFHNALQEMNAEIHEVISTSNENFKKILNERLNIAYENLKAEFKKQYSLSEIQNNFPQLSIEAKYPAENAILTRTIQTAQGSMPIYIWERRHTTPTPYTLTHYWDSIADKQKIVQEEYVEKYAQYKTYTHEYYKDKEYVVSRQKYREDYKESAKIINTLGSFITKDVQSVQDLLRNKKAIIDKLATKAISDGESTATYIDSALVKKYESILPKILNDYADDINAAIQYMQDPAQYNKRYRELLQQFYAQFSPHDQRLLKQIEHAVSDKQSVYLTNTLPFSKEFKTKMRVQVPMGEGRGRMNLAQEFNNLHYAAYTEKLNKDVLTKITEDLRKELGERNNAILKTRFEPIKEEIYKRTREEYPFYKYTDITLWDPVKKQQELNRLISRATDANAKGSLYNLFNRTPEEFINELAYRNRFITFSEADVADHKLNGMFNKFKNTLPETVYLHHDVKNHRYWIVLKNSEDLKLTQSGRQVYLNGNPILRLQKPKRFDEFRMVDEYIGPEGPKLTEMLNSLNDDLYELTGTPLGDSQGEYLTKEMLEDIYIQMPQEVKDALPKLEEWTDKQFFEACRFNESIIGSATSKRELGLYSTNQIINTRNALQSAIGYLKPKNEYINAVFNSSLSINSPNSIWAQFTDEELLEALQITDEYKLVTLVNDPKYGVKTREIIPSSVDAIKKAKELGAVIIPQQTYKDMYNVVNHRLGSNGFMKLWSRIIYCYKFGYLLNPAAWIRNWIDTNIKSRFALGREKREYQKRARDTLADIRDMSDAIKDQQNLAFKRAEIEYLDLARDIFEDKDRIEKFIQRRSRDGIIREEEIQKWFADPNNKKRILTYESYKELRDDFLSQGVSGNVMADLYKGSGCDAWNTFTQLTGNIVEFGNKFENTQRLAQYLYELDHGETYTTALSKIAKTHFDYSFKTKAEQLTEMVFPFTTFSLRNASYWIEMIEKHPWIMRNYVHLMKPSWDFKDYTPAELARDRRAQAQILYGQIKLGEFNDKVLTFKANPSIQDALQMFSDPINNVYDKLAAPFAAIRDAAKGKEVNIMNTLPIAGPVIQNVQKTIQTGSPLPSLVGVNKKYQRFKSTKWSNPNLSGTNKYTDSTYRTPKYRKNVVYDAYTTRGITRYRANFYPIIDIAHDIKMRYSTNVYNQIKNRVKTDVYQGVRYRIKLDVNRFR